MLNESIGIQVPLVEERPSHLKPTWYGGKRLVQCRTGYAKGAVYCGRGKGGDIPAPGEYGWLGNPHPIGRHCAECNSTHVTARDTLEPYRVYLRRRLAEDEAFAAAFDAVMIEADKLACYCPDLHCHTAVMVEEWGRRLMEAADATGT